MNTCKAGADCSTAGSVILDTGKAVVNAATSVVAVPINLIGSGSLPGDPGYIAAPQLEYDAPNFGATVETGLTLGASNAVLNKVGASTRVEASVAEAGVGGATAGSIRNVNPGYPVAGRTENCVNCVVATDATLAGTPAVALPTTGPVGIRVLERQYGGSFSPPTTINSVEQQLAAAGDGARGIVFGARGTDTGHVFNVVNQNGIIRFLDGQTGQPATFTGFSSFQLLRTK